jgi:hypothetical protein
MQVDKGNARLLPPVTRIHQSRNYLRAAAKPLCLLINFGRPRTEVRRAAVQA